MKNFDTETKKNFARDFLSKMMGFSVATWISFIISFMSTPIITRVFLPEEIGKINLYNTYLTMVIVLSLLGIDQSFVRFYNEPFNENGKKRLLSLCLTVTLITATVVSVFIYYCKNIVALEIANTINEVIPICLIISLFANVFLRFTSLDYRMKNNIMLYSIQGIALAVIGKVLYIVTAFWNPTYNNAILTMTIGYCIVTAVFLVIYIKDMNIKKNYYDKKIIFELFKFGLPLLPVSLLAWLNNSISQLMLNRYVDFSAIGIYSNAVAIASVISLLQTGFNTYWTSFVYSSYKTEGENIKKVHQYITLAMVAFGLIIVLGQDILYTLLGENFRSSKNFFPFLLVSPICYTIAETTGIGIGISKKTYLNMAVFSINVFVNLLLCVILLPQLGMLGAAISAACSSVVMLVLKTIIGERYYKCVTSYVRTFSAVGVIVLSAVINLMFFEYLIPKYLCIIVLLLILFLIYKIEITCLIKFITNIFKDRIAN